MVKGIELFRDKFKDFADCYTVIGGAACDILMTEADTDFRATKDIDMILIMEERHQEFASVFWDFIREGGYRCGWKNSEEVHFYRFTDPKPGYPVQIELFSRKPDYHLGQEAQIIPVHISDDISSLSAILLNDDFYRFMMDGRRVIDGISILDAAYLIPFKMYAWLDLLKKKSDGEHVNERDLKKHKYDVFRLLDIVPNDTRIPVFGAVWQSIEQFVIRIQPEPLPLQNLGLEITKERGIEFIGKIYRLNDNLENKDVPVT